ncbi:hypothetical protein FOA52_013425 [Chlamydomonas sp. UWO 241]|nr:hypothetical protein FOA52_013425 [Chlamydomonas sp. UWO 241]
MGELPGLAGLLREMRLPRSLRVRAMALTALVAIPMMLLLLLLSLYGDVPASSALHAAGEVAARGKAHELPGPWSTKAWRFGPPRIWRRILRRVQPIVHISARGPPSERCPHRGGRSHTSGAPHAHTSPTRTNMMSATAICLNGCPEASNSLLNPTPSTTRPKPYTKPRVGVPGELPGGAPRSVWRWDALVITRGQFDAVPEWLRFPDSCMHCIGTVKFKLLRGQLRVKGGPPPWASPEHWGPLVEQLLLVAHLYPDLPDIDLWCTWGMAAQQVLKCSHKQRWHPVLSWNICRDHPLAGFTLPTYSAWRASRSSAALDALHRCLEARYPHGRRTASAFWRGGTSDKGFNAELGWPITVENVFNVSRVQMVRLAAPFHPRIDAAVVDLHETNTNDEAAVRALLPRTSHKQPFEDFNRRAVVLDMDGNGWSDRFVQLAHFNSPILKQTSNATAFFEHLLAPGSAIETFSNDLSDFVGRSSSMLAELESDPARLQRQVRHRQLLAKSFLTTLAVTAALAYTLDIYAGLADWTVAEEPGYERVDPRLCCRWVGLPHQVVRRMHDVSAS